MTSPSFKALAVAVLTAAACPGVTVAAPPENDDLGAAVELPPSGPATLGSNVGATLELSEPVPAGYTAASYTATAWWWLELAAGEAVWYEVETTDSTFDTVLSIWAGDDYSSPLSLIHVNNDAATGSSAGSSRIRFLAQPFTVYKVAVAGHGSGQQGEVAVRAFASPPGPFAQVTSASLPSVVDLAPGPGTVTATLNIEANQEIGSGEFRLYGPAGAVVASVPFSSTNRISGNVVSGTYQVTATVPQAAPTGTYRWQLDLTSVQGSAYRSSYGWEGLTPLPSGTPRSLNVIKAVTYATWAAENNLTGPGSAAGEDYDGDGISNLEEFALGLNPREAAQATLAATPSTLTRPGLPHIYLAGTGPARKLRVEYPRRLADPLLTYTVQFSSDLVTWTNATQQAEPVVSDGTFEAMAVEDTLTVDDTIHRFARLRIVR